MIMRWSYILHSKKKALKQTDHNWLITDCFMHKHKVCDAHSQNSPAAMLTSSVDAHTHIVDILLVYSESQLSKNRVFDFCLCLWHMKAFPVSRWLLNISLLYCH